MDKYVACKVDSLKNKKNHLTSYINMFICDLLIIII